MLWLLTLAPLPVSAKQSPEDEAAPVPSARDLEAPCTGRHDWLHLSSSEWLKGDLRRMRSREVEFWSREMKSQRIKWRKVVVLCIGEEARFVSEANKVFTGRGRVEDGKVVVETVDGPVSFPREDLLAILPGRDRELERWGLRVGAGLDANAGNTEQISFNANIAIRREDRRNRGEIAYGGTIGTVDGRENVGRHRLELGVDHFFTKNVYWSMINMPAMYDKFQNLEVRITPSTGPGWQIFDGADFEWEVEAGLGYQYTRFISVSPGSPASVSDVAIRLSTNLKWDIISNLELTLNHGTTIVPTDTGLTNLYTRAALKYEITWLLKLETAVIHNRVWKPVPLGDGSVPKPDDLQVILGLNFETY